MMDTRTFPNRPTSVKQARRFVAEHLAQVADDIADAITLMVSELATNSIRHANVGFTVTVDLRTDEVRVVVADSGPGSPQLLSPSPSEPHGRGLQIVTELSDDWGFTTSESTGTSVWFIVRLVGDDQAADSNVLSSQGMRSGRGSARQATHRSTDAGRPGAPGGHNARPDHPHQSSGGGLNCRSIRRRCRAVSESGHIRRRRAGNFIRCRSQVRSGLDSSGAVGRDLSRVDLVRDRGDGLILGAVVVGA